MGHESVPYSKRQVVADSIEFTAAWIEKDPELGIAVHGTCPGCRVEMTSALPSFFPGAVSGGGAEADALTGKGIADKLRSILRIGRAVAEKPETAPITCNCGLSHVEQTADKAVHHNCGAVFVADLKWE